MYCQTPRRIAHLLQQYNQHFHFSSSPLFFKNVDKTLEKSYKTLEIPLDCDSGQLREAYINLAKKYHPDSGAKTADAAKFAQVEEAYNKVKENLQKEEETEEDGAVEEKGDLVFDIRHTAPQHRQYLSFEGIGTGTPSQRQKQFEQYRVVRAADNVYEHRTQKLSSHFESRMVTKDKVATKKIKTRTGIDRLVEDLIAESMARGDFDNLPGKGKPLEYSNHNPFVDTTTHNLNRVLIKNGYAPEWVLLEKEIRELKNKTRIKLAHDRLQKNNLPPNVVEDLWWNNRIQDFRKSFEDINRKINKLNMIVPSMTQQMIPYNIQREMSKILDNYEAILNENNLLENETTTRHKTSISQTSLEDTSLKETVGSFWKGLKGLIYNR